MKFANFITLGLLKIFANTAYRIENRWLNDPGAGRWKDVRLMIFLNHTSLYEFLFLGATPWSFMLERAGKIVLPGADVTLRKNTWGTLYRMVLPRIIPISRERDGTWDHFLKQIGDDCMVLITPEGRMKRLNGLDKHGKPMSVRGGVVDIMKMIGKGKMLIVYSGGLHHVAPPGVIYPKLFKTIRIHTEAMMIEDYIAEIEAQINAEGTLTKGNTEFTFAFKKAVIADLEARMKINSPLPDKNCPQPPATD